MKSTKRQMVGVSIARQKKQNLKEAGITLVALVVTIIVLLILAGVTLTLALSNNGVMDRAKYASNTWANATKKETAMFGELDQQIGDLSNFGGGSGGGSGIIIKAGSTDLSKAVPNLKTNEALKAYYGQTTDFTSVEGVEWQLFYDDEDYYFLIASDYVPGNLLPSELYRRSSYPNSPYFIWYDEDDDVWIGPLGSNNKWSSGADSVAITSNSLTNKYLKWVNSSVATVKNNKNMQAVAYMMDTDVWSSFAGGINGAFAMGGPTIEMLVKSFNAADVTEDKFSTYDVVDSTNANSNGYNIPSGPNAYSLLGNNDERNMWFSNETKNYQNHMTGYWIASPSGNENYYVFSGALNTYSSGCLIGNTPVDSSVNQEIGFRPLVAIPK